MQLWAKPLTWGLTYEQLTKRYGYKIDIHNDKIRVNSLTIQNFPSDCGSLIITGANSATTENLSLVIDIASCCGFNKIFATVVGENKENAVKAFKSKRFKLVFQGKSNRSSYKDDYVFVKYIRNCKWKGYGGTK